MQIKVQGFRVVELDIGGAAGKTSASSENGRSCPWISPRDDSVLRNLSSAVRWKQGRKTGQHERSRRDARPDRGRCLEESILLRVWNQWKSDCGYRGFVKRQFREENKGNQEQIKLRRSVAILSSAPSRAGVEGCPVRRKCIARLRTSPVSWLGGSSGPLNEDRCGAFPAGSPSEGATGRSGLRNKLNPLTVARRRRLSCWRSPEIARIAETVFPSTKFAVNVVCSAGPQGWG